MPIDLPYRFASSGYPSAPQVQVNFDRLLQDLQNTLTLVGDITLTGAGKGLVLTTPDGLHTYRLAIDNSGNPTYEQLT